MDSTSINPSQNLKDENFPRSPGKGYLNIGLASGLILAFFLSIYIANRPYSYQGSLIDPPLPAADFQLNDQNGNPFVLSKQSGKVVLIFFGYTQCPDVCPVTLVEYKRIREQLGAQANNVQFVFITVDPERDTPEILREHLSNFDSSIIGLSGDRSVLEKIWDAYGIAQVKREVDSSAGYLVDHTARLYVVDKAGSLRLTYPFGYELEKIVEDLIHLLREDED